MDANLPARIKDDEESTDEDDDKDSEKVSTENEKDAKKAAFAPAAKRKSRKRTDSDDDDDGSDGDSECKNLAKEKRMGTDNNTMSINTDKVSHEQRWDEMYQRLVEYKNKNGEKESVDFG